MSLHNLKSLSQVSNELRKQGYKTEFNFKDGKLIPLGKDHSYTASDVAIRREFRFEGETNPADESILYALECKDGEKGIISNGYGAYANQKLEQFLQNTKGYTREVI